MFDVIKIYKDSKEQGATDEDILDYIEYLESIENCNREHERVSD